MNTLKIERIEREKEEGWKGGLFYSEEQVSIFIYVPFDYKNAFKRKFKPSWNNSEKLWVVTVSEDYADETIAEIETYIEMKNKRIEKGTAAKNGKKDQARIKRNTNRKALREAFEDYCDDLDIFSDEERARAWKEFNK